MQYYYVLVDMVMYFICQPMPWVAMLPQLGKHTKKAQHLQILALHKFTQHVFQLVATTNLN